MKLSDYAHGRDNNFNLIRLLAAVTVLISHCFPLASGSRAMEPFLTELNMSIGGMAVDIFFLTSGFLVTASLLTRQNALEFVSARILRIVPGLWMMLLLVVVFLGGTMTSLPLGQYLTSDMLIEYVLKCGTLLTGVTDYLPGVFANNPFGSMVNIPLWTLPYELDMYGLLLVTWVLVALSGRRRAALFRYAMLGFSVLGVLFLIVGYFRHGLPTKFELHSTYAFPSLFYMFFTGAAVYVLRDRINLSGRLFGVAAFALLASALNRHVFFVVYLFTVPYLLFYLAYVPAGRIRAFNRCGDYSYGVYIYGFPYSRRSLRW